MLSTMTEPTETRRSGRPPGRGVPARPGAAAPAGAGQPHPPGHHRQRGRRTRRRIGRRPGRRGDRAGRRGRRRPAGPGRRGRRLLPVGRRRRRPAPARCWPRWRCTPTRRPGWPTWTRRCARSRRSPPATGSAASARPGWTSSAPATRAAPRRRRASGRTSPSPSGTARRWSSTTGTRTPTCCASSTTRAPRTPWCCTASPATPTFAAECVRRGYLLSFAGTVTFASAAALREAAALTPLDQMLVETDAPVPHPDAAPRPAQRLVPDPADGAGAGRRPPAPTWTSCAPPSPPPATGSSARGEPGPTGGPHAAATLLRMTGLLGPAEIRELAARLGVAPTKKLGQNFVHDPNTVRRIVTAAGLAPDDVVLEVGPGLGSLTLALLPVAGARARRGDRPGAGRRAAGDRRPARRPGRRPADRAPRRRAARHGRRAADPAPTALVANLPYNVAVPVVLHLLAELPTLRHGLVMVQKEVADRLVAGPGSKVYGMPSVKLAWYARARAGRPGAAERVLAGAQRRLRPGRLHPPRAAPRRRTPRTGLRGGRRGVRAAPQDAARRAGRLGRRRGPGRRRAHRRRRRPRRPRASR